MAKVEIIRAKKIGLEPADQVYKKWVEANPNIKIISAFEFDERIIVTYEE